MQLMTDAAATLGSRFNLIFDPHERRLYQNAYGDFREQPLELTVGLRTAQGQLWVLPFGSDGEPFPFLTQTCTLTTIAYRGVHPGLGVDFTMRIRAPFYPHNVGISTSPCHFVDLEIKRLVDFRFEEAEHPLARGELIFRIDGEGVKFTPVQRGFHYSFTSTAGTRTGTAPPSVVVRTWVESDEAEPAGLAGLRREFDLGDGSPCGMGLIWSSWADEAVLEVFGEKTAFKYRELFDSRDEMVAWAAEEKGRIEKRCDLLDGAIRDWCLGTSASSLAALALHSFLVDTWWTVRKDGRDWFSVWEGSCFFHSTIDVEYNDAMLYFALWPGLLQMLLDEWADFEMDGTEALGPDGKGTGYLCHDMGADHVVGRQVYPHHMEVEENADYLLLLTAWVAFTGAGEAVEDKLPLCRRLAEFIVRADTTGNGVPDAGMANTIDDATPAVQYGREQVYLAVKAHAALWALADLEQKCKAKGSKAERWRAFASKGIKTIEDKAWLDDHYAVTLSQTTDGLTDPWSGEALAPGVLAGWDDCSIYTANGLLYLFLAGINLPRWKLNRFATDVENSCRATLGPYGCRHSSSSANAVWFSQNMWRDYVAAYLGVDLLNNVERYWDYQLTTGRNWGSALYYDTNEKNRLNFYPRGTTVFGMPLSAVGLRLNRRDGELTISPLRSTMRVPLLPLADWEQMRIPVLTVRNREGVAVARISERDLLKGLTLNVVGAEVDPD